MDVVNATAALVESAPAPSLRALYKTMLRIRRFEQRAEHLFAEGLIKGTVHSYIGQEAIAAGVCAALGERDYIGSYHRGHGHCIAKGADMKRMMAELLGRSTGYCRGLGGSMHIADLSLGILGANGIVGAAMPICSGAALAAKLRADDRVAVAFFGDGAANQGVFHESLNLAAIWQLPLVFVCENNRYALSTPASTMTGGRSIAERSVAFGIPSAVVDGNDPAAVYAAARDALDRARRGEGATLLEAHTYRHGQHSTRASRPDPRPGGEVADWIARDPLVHLHDMLVESGAATRRELEALDEEASSEVDAAVEFAKAGAPPEIGVAAGAVYAPFNHESEPEDAGERSLTFVEALNEALAQEMERDERVVVLGEDIGAHGGLFHATKDLMTRFGADRVRDTPISEATFVGCGVGAAAVGLRPIVELQIFDFVCQTMDMIVNQAAKLRFMFGGTATIPIVIRGPQGGGIRLAAQHSQSLESWFAHVPGLVVVAPSTPYEAKGLLISAIRNDNPVIFLESKLLYLGGSAPVPAEPYAIPLGKGVVKRAGSDVTVVATMAMVPRALSAAMQLAREDISVEVIDPRTLQPLDEGLILDSVKKTSRLVIAHEACTAFGFGAEVAALAAEKAFDWLDAPIMRIGAPFMPMPYADELERAVIPSQQSIVDAVRQVMA